MANLGLGDLQQRTSDLWDAYAKSADYGSNQSPLYQAYMDAKKQQYAAVDQSLVDNIANQYKSTGVDPYAAMDQYYGTAKGQTINNVLGMQQPTAQPSGGVTVGGATGGVAGGSGGTSGGYGGASSGGFGGGYNGSITSNTIQPGSGNPYLQDQANAIRKQYTTALNEDVLPGIGQGAVMAGGYGGSRMGIAQGKAINGMGQNLSGALANLYGNNYQQDQATNTARMGQNMQYNLGLGGLENSRYNMDQGFYTTNRQLDQSGAALGANLYNQGTQGNLGQGQGIYNIGGIQQNAPWAVTNNATNNTSPYTGTGVSNIQTQQGSTIGNALGGALAGSQLWNLGFGQR